MVVGIVFAYILWKKHKRGKAVEQAKNTD
jgi:hypothetical protein